ncbi:MAG: hypothetical protein GX811_06380 [Lentisphaerae bacterium]|nr:hypothetical protein [Lentisphaerota bacterium]
MSRIHERLLVAPFSSLNMTTENQQTKKTNNRFKKFSGLAFLILFVVSTVYWTFYIPHKPERLLRAIPENAIFVSALYNFDDRFESCSANPITKDFYKTLYDTAKLNGIDLNSNLFKRISSRLLSKGTVLTYTAHPEPLIHAAVWVGSDSVLLRWLL